MNMEILIYLKSFLVLFLVLAIMLVIYMLAIECQLSRQVTKENINTVTATPNAIALSEIQQQREHDAISMDPEGLTKPATDVDETGVYLLMPETNEMVSIKPFCMFEFQPQQSVTGP